MQLQNMTVKPVDKENWFACTQLRISEENGKRFIVPIVYSIAESKVETHLRPLAILLDQEVIGFSMYCKDPDDGRYWIYVFMIDAEVQGKGYGKAGLQRVVEYMKDTEDLREIIIGHQPDNERAGYLYESVGFKLTGEQIHGEIIRLYTC
ncbi:hypothetical protein BVG16_12180 [Paenibacillus selenitireducens]|uniref:N-acetyltransferase domain-containing protein n=1 Tax=Paenibacillus selenitireducens TaxID=1324314 RepID=A0A1T2XG16_9BACL|nr:GNAT family N-acetyltransferase [Paenibacillus selenitireducens]OPA78616.1 hypothetical protein BVG16_12180 [Paenibacillus selenitireducens]